MSALVACLTVERDGDEIDLVISAATYTPACRGRTSGEPERCSPSEPADVELGEIRLDVPGGHGELWTGELTDAEEGAARTALLEGFGGEDDGDDGRGDYEYDLARDDDDRCHYGDDS